MKMNRALLLGTVASLLVLGAFAKPAAADVFVNVNVTKTQDIDITESISKTKNVNVNVTDTTTDTGSAEANAVVNVTNNHVMVDGGCTAVSGGACTGDPVTSNFNIHRKALIDSSINQNTGIVGVNQDVGDFANQANVVSFALTNGPNAVTDAKGLVSQENLNSSSIDEEFFALNIDVLRPATINNSVDSNTGITGVNQNVGNMNNQTNVVALAVGKGANVALSDAALGQLNSNDTVSEVNTVRHEDITGSVDTNTGITQVNQSNGNFNNQGSVISFSALTSSTSIGVNANP